MPHYDRIGEPILNGEGKTIETNIRLSNNSHIEITGGLDGYHFKLKFSSHGNEGWWVDRGTLGELIAELLYIRQDVIQHWGEERAVDHRADHADDADEPDAPLPGAPF